MHPCEADHRPLLLDTTMFWNERGGGVRRYLLSKRAWLRQRGGWRHVIAAPGAHGDGDVDLGGLTLPRSGGYRVPLSRAAAARALCRQAPDVIECGDPYRLAWAALDAGQRLGVPTLAYCHSDLPALAAHWAGGSGAPARWARRVAERYLAHVYREFDQVLAPSRALCERLLALGLDQAALQPLGVDTVCFSPSRADPLLRQRLGLPPDAVLLMYAGRFAPEKNLRVLVDAVARLGAPYVLLAIGDGPAPPPVHPRVHVLPYVGDSPTLARLYASADAFVHAGDQETFGLAVLEAMACATPVIVRDAGGLAELAAGGAGVAVASASPADWAEAIAAVFAGGRAPLAARALARAQEYRWERVLAALLRRYGRLMGAPRALDGRDARPSVA